MLKDLKEFVAKVQADEALQERLEELAKSSERENMFANCSEVAAEMGYTITEEDMQELLNECQGDLSEEELGKLAGGIGILGIWGYYFSDGFKRQVMCG